LSLAGRGIDSRLPSSLLRDSETKTGTAWKK